MVPGDMMSAIGRDKLCPAVALDSELGESGVVRVCQIRGDEGLRSERFLEQLCGEYSGVE